MYEAVMLAGERERLKVKAMGFLVRTLVTKSHLAPARRDCVNGLMHSYYKHLSLVSYRWKIKNSHPVYKTS